jgi:hypothetical protein
MLRNEWEHPSGTAESKYVDRFGEQPTLVVPPRDSDSEVVIGGIDFAEIRVTVDEIEAFAREELTKFPPPSFTRSST